MAIQSITSGIIADGAIVATDIGDGIVTNAKLAGSITSDKITSVSNTAISGLIEAAQIGSVSNTALPAGSVLQVVQATNSTGYTGTTGAETALFNFSVTPLFASSKIAIFVSLAAAATGTKTNYALTFRLRRGTTTAGTLIQNIRYGQYQGGVSAARELYAPVPLNGLDSPATTSSQSYCITIEDINGTPDYIVNGNGNTSIILMEIAA
jgi:hypothetical protein